MKNKKSEYIILGMVSLILLFTPYLGEALRTFNTFIHESGHAITTLITGNSVKEIELYQNTEGVTKTLVNSRFDEILISLSGYLATSIFILIMACSIKKEKSKWMYYAITLLAVINLVFLVRNMYGFVWITLFVLGLGYVIFKKKEWINNVMNTLLIILIVDGTRAVIDILTLSIKTPNDAGDATGLSEATLIPDAIWGTFFLVQHIVTLWFVYKILKKDKKR